MVSTDAAARRSPVELGYWLSSEEHGPTDLVANAGRAEQAGFTTAMLSDHLHPWLPVQGQSPFSWAVLGGIANATSVLRVGTGVSSAVHRIPPLVLAHAAATVEVMMPGRFFLGLGTGERLNEQVMGQRWPTAPERRSMLEETITIIRALWEGDEVSHRGDHFTVEHAQLATCPDTPPPILVAAGGPRSAKLAGEHGDGLLTVAPDPSLVDAFEAAGGAGKPRMGQLHVCWAETEDEARRVADRQWPVVGIPGRLLTELARPADFAAAVEAVTPQTVADAVVCGPDPEKHIAAIVAFVAAGVPTIHIHQIGPDQQGFLDFYSNEVLPVLETGGAR